jgi:FtsP/CotA-like multicopper oxidase with cupredoxin domain
VERFNFQTDRCREIAGTTIADWSARGRRALSLTAVLSSVLMVGASPAHLALELVRPNPNTARAGVLRDGVLTVTLEAKESLVHLAGPNRPPTTIEAFAEPGKPPQMPAPLIRARAGTEIRLAIHNSLALPLTVFVPALVHGGPDRIEAMDSVVVQPAEDGILTTRATTPGNYVYRAIPPTRSARTKGIAGVLAGALVVDSANASAQTRDRVFVIMLTWDSLKVACGDTAVRVRAECADVGRVVSMINGLSWPNTDRIRATVGDSLHWRVINASDDVHPMHLHGFYYRVDEYSGLLADVQAGRPAPGQLVATQTLPSLAGMAMTWSPDRAGNWLFHCHFSLHLVPDSLSAASDDPHMRDMVGLVIGINVAPKAGVQAAGEPVAARKLRLVALEDSTDSVGHSHTVLPSMHFVLVDGRRRIEAGSDFSPELDLVRGEPVAITIVNRMSEPTTIHWHGVEVQDSYVDGVPGFSGSGRRVAPAIAPGDSFTARFTPPRSGTFMYHAHVDDNREQSAGLIGPLIVRDPGMPASPNEHVFFIKSSRIDESGRLDGGGSSPLEINGQVNPDTVVLHVGSPARLRFINLSAHHSSAMSTVRLGPADGDWKTTSPDALLMTWRPIAKDGADLPASDRAPRAARQVVAIGETYDFEFTPDRRGTLRLLVSSTPGPLQKQPGPPLVAVPIRVR